MPIYTFRFADGREIDEIFVSWRDAPQELTIDGEVARRVPSRVNTHFPSPHLQAAAREGLVPYERGMERDAARAREYRQQQQDAERRRIIGETLSQF